MRQSQYSSTHITTPSTQTGEPATQKPDFKLQEHHVCLPLSHSASVTAFLTLQDMLPHSFICAIRTLHWHLQGCEFEGSFHLGYVYNHFAIRLISSTMTETWGIHLQWVVSRRQAMPTFTRTATPSYIKVQRRPLSHFIRELWCKGRWKTQ